MITSMVEVAVRGLLLAAAVGAGLRLLRVGNVLAQKATWSLVLAAAMAMPALLPVALRWNGPAAATLAVPAHWVSRLNARAAGSQPRGATGGGPDSTPARNKAQAPAPIEAAPAGTARSYAAAIEPSTSSPSRDLQDDLNPAVPAFAGGTAKSTIQSPPPMAHSSRIAPASLLPTLSTLAALAYLAVTAALLLRLLYGAAAALLLWWEASPADLPGGTEPALRLRSSRAVSSPVTIGSGVVLPDDYGEWDTEKLRIVLAHERSHIRQGDFYLQLLAGLYAAVFWFSPLGWWLQRKLSDLGEAISDRAGLEEAASRASYAHILLEFAALPRPTPIGVAMARTSSVSHRIERLLNDASFCSAFSAGRRRALLAVLLVPVALFASTALIRVKAAEAARPATAAQATPAAAPQAAQAPVTGQSNPDQAAAQAPELAQAPAQPLPSPDQVPAVAPAPPAAAPVPADVAPEPPASLEPPEQDNDSVRTITNDHNNHVVTSKGRGNGHGSGYGYSYSSNGDSYALISGSDQHINFSGDRNGSTMAALDKARTMAHGKFLWFTHDGKSYFVDDASIVDGIEAMYKPMEGLGRQQEELGRQQEKLGKEQERLGQLQEQASVPTPDVSKEIAALNAALAKLQTKNGGTVTQDDLAEIQGKIGDIQGRLGDLEGKIGDAQGKLGDQQGKLGEEQGKLGEQQGKLGEEEGRIAEEADRKIKSIIDQSLKNGKARPVE